MNEEILKRIDALAAKLGVAGTELWRILIRQAGVDAIFDSLYIGLSGITICVLVKFLFWGLKRNEKKQDDDIIAICIISVISVIGILASIVFLLVNLNDLPTALFNPEYRALELLRNALR